MRLFQTDTPEGKQAVFTASKNRFGTGTAAILWVNGMNSPTCAKIDNTNGPFVESSQNCATQCWSWCEKVV